MESSISLGSDVKLHSIRVPRRKPKVAKNNNKDTGLIANESEAPLVESEAPLVESEAPLVESEAPLVEIKPIKRAKPKVASDLLDSSVPVVSNTHDCSILYDPCNKNILERVNPINGNDNYDIKILDKRIREIKNIRDNTLTSLFGLNNATSNYYFLMNVFCNKNISLDDMVSFRLQEGGQIGADIFEVLCRLFVIFGGIESVDVLNGNFQIMTKIEDSTSILPDVKSALETMKCKATSKMGVSDITLINVKASDNTIKPDSLYCEVECDVKPTNEIKTYLMSVKWYLKEKGAEHYDLEKLYLAGDNLVSTEKMPFGIIVFLKSKLDFQKAHRRSYRQYVSRIADTFYGWNEDVKPFLEDIRKTIFQNSEILNKTPQELIETNYLKSSSKPILSLQLHQELIVHGINDLIEENPYNDNRYVVGVLPRGGKTFIAGGIIREFINRRKLNESTKINILWITAAPNETRSQVGSELILKFQDFDNFNFVDVKKLSDFSEKVSKPNTVWFSSIQLLTATTAGRAREREFLDKLISGSDEDNKINMIFFDEAHAGGAGQENKLIIEKLIENYSNTIPFLFLTATYLGIIVEYNIIKPNLFVWDYTDVLKTRSLGTKTEREDAIENIKMRFGDKLVTKIINRRLENTDSYEAMAKPYLDFPELYFISSDFNEEAKERFYKQDLYNPNMGFSLSGIFGLKPDYHSYPIKTADNKIRKDAYKIFANLENPRNLISLITPSDPLQTFEFESPGGDPFTVDTEYEQTILKRIDRLSYQTGSRFRIDEYPTLLMFLPTGGKGSNIYKLLPAFATLLMSHTWWNKRYEVACIISDNDKSPSDETLISAIEERTVSADNIRIIDKNLKSEIIKYERELHCRSEGNKKGLVILAGERLSMGISLPCTDCVFLLNETKSPDDIIQKMYRALTPSIGKKSSFVVDLNPIRSLSAVYGYTRAAYESAVTKSKILDIIYEIYSWDEDIINLKLEKGGSQRITSSQEKINEMLERASKDTEYELIFKNIGGLEKRLAKNISKKVNELGIMPFLRNISIGKITTKNGVTFSDKANIVIKSGKVIVRLEKENIIDTNNDLNKEKIIEDIVVIQNFTDAISDFLKYLAITSKEDMFDKALNEFEDDIANNSGKSLQTDVLELLKARGAIQDYVYLPMEKQVIKNPIYKSLIIQLFIDAVRYYSPDTSRELFRQMRGKIDEPSTRKNEVLKIIHRHLTPKKVQKDTHGEVFTPINMVEYMLDKLPKSIWSNPDLKILDPANGIGNFPIIAFYRFNEGLKSIIKNEEKRKKHIIENMLYMMEIQPNNNRITRNIFSKLCEGCTPNIWTIDSLKVTYDNIRKHDWPDQYDIIMGNPPFNPPKTDSGSSGNSIWPNFVMKSYSMLKDKGYLVLIHPPGWKKPTDDEYNPDKFASGNFIGQIRQGQIWQLLRENGIFSYIYTNDQKSKTIGEDYLPFFPAVDFYVYQKNVSTKNCATKNIFIGTIKTEDDVKLNYDLDFLPNLITKETQYILNKITSKAGHKILMKRGLDERHISKWSGKQIDWFYDANKTGFKFKKYGEVAHTKSGLAVDTVSIDKVVMNFGGGIDGYNVEYVSADSNKGVLDMSMYMIVKDSKDATHIENFLKSDLIKFIFLITQYASGKNTKNEPLVANSITIPPNHIKNYYSYFDIEKYKDYIESMLETYKIFSAPKRLAITPKLGGKHYKLNKTRKTTNK